MDLSKFTGASLIDLLKIPSKSFCTVIADFESDVGNRCISVGEQGAGFVDTQIVEEIMEAGFDMVEEDVVHPAGGEAEEVGNGLKRNIFRIIAIQVSKNLEADLVIIGLAQTADLTVAGPKFIGGHSGFFIENMAEVSSIKETDHIRQFFQLEGGVQEEVHRFGKAHGDNQVAVAHPADVLDVLADGGLTHVKVAGQVLQGQLGVQVLIDVLKDFQFFFRCRGKSIGCFQRVIVRIRLIGIDTAVVEDEEFRDQGIDVDIRDLIFSDRTGRPGGDSDFLLQLIADGFDPGPAFRIEADRAVIGDSVNDRDRGT